MSRNLNGRWHSQGAAARPTRPVPPGAARRRGAAQSMRDMHAYRTVTSSSTGSGGALRSRSIDRSRRQVCKAGEPSSSLRVSLAGAAAPHCRAGCVAIRRSIYAAHRTAPHATCSLLHGDNSTCTDCGFHVFMLRYKRKIIFFLDRGPVEVSGPARGRSAGGPGRPRARAVSCRRPVVPTRCSHS
jgi:hypothetical protein